MKLPGSIPVRRYLKKYVMHVERLQAGQALDLSRRGAIPLFLGSLLTGKLNYDSARDDEMPQEGYYDDELTFVLDVYRSTKTKMMLSYEAVRMFDAFLYHDFHDHLLTRITFARQFNITEARVIDQVMHELSIVEDISFDALKKSQSRLKKTREKAAFLSQKCLCPAARETSRALCGNAENPPVP
jgi:hypothetical protein